ncbi:high mobility group B protein 6-like [Cucurbita maxima]|uniref:High mobility group B protein 6-like n=1 Tax=Cucurbita maxima TaxID=3661 RepID=A0A6J1J813_CUCMA|nr:high mobility group B protein 6-like [Cucurbita maxima]XP_022985393.1 high mobility group B protein 6-like [Cucurbita maxima]
MASTAEIPKTKKPRNSRKALKDKNSTPEEPQSESSMVTKVTQPSEEEILLSQNQSSAKKSKSKAAPKKQPAKQSFDKELQEMQEMLQQMRLDKEKTEELLKAKDEMLKQKDEELKTRDVEQEKLQIELKKLQKLKEFKPIMNFPMIQILKDKEQKKKEKKKCAEKKRPSPPYILWCKDQWNEIKKENPEAEFKEISNILGAKWKNVTADEKKPYEERYQAEKQAYLQVTSKEKRESEAMKLLEEEQKQKTAMELLDQYLQFKGEAEKENKKKKKEKDPLKPKHPMSAFFLFSNERRASLLAENKNVLEVAKITGEEWKNMTEEQRGPYEEMARKNKEKYMQEMEIYKHQKEEEAAILKKEEEEQMKLHKHEALLLLKKKEKTETIIKKTKEERQKKKKEGKKSVDPNKPKKPASSYILFSKEARKSVMEERPGANNSTVNALISVKWKELSEGERKMWNEKAAEAMDAYRKEVEEYNKTVGEMKG